MITWTEKFATGSSTLDQQHRILIDHINRLETILSILHPTMDDYASMLQVIIFLESYSDAHFKIEEQCMEACRCPAHAKNKQAHADFIKFFSNFKDRYRMGGFPREDVVQLHQFASRWVESHILQVDIRLKSCVKP